jgi:hypothetical protein
MPKANVVSCGVAEVFACFDKPDARVVVLCKFRGAVCGCVVRDYELMGWWSVPETFYYLPGRFRKPQRAQRHAEKNNKSLRLSASSAVNLFCHDSFIQNKLKSHSLNGRGTLRNIQI